MVQRFTALVNNAGWATQSPLEFEDVDNMEKMFKTNVFDTLRLTQKFLKLIREHQSRIINVSSLLGKMVLPKIGT
jgi:short-subunit dehydrogenase